MIDNKSMTAISAYALAEAKKLIDEIEQSIEENDMYVKENLFGVAALHRYLNMAVDVSPGRGEPADMHAASVVIPAEVLERLG